MSPDFDCASMILHNRDVFVQHWRDTDPDNDSG
jgi:hypothetical protein